MPIDSLVQVAAPLATLGAAGVALWIANRGADDRRAELRVEARRRAALPAVVWAHGAQAQVNRWWGETNSLGLRPPTPSDERRALAEAHRAEALPVDAELTFVLGPGTEALDAWRAELKVYDEACEILSSPMPLGHHRPARVVMKSLQAAHSTLFNELGEVCDLDLEAWPLEAPGEDDAEADEPEGGGGHPPPPGERNRTG